MNIDENKIDDMTLALMYLTLHDTNRAWKQMDWGTLDRLHKKGLIYNPVGKAKSVELTDDGVKQSKQLFESIFATE